ncbi:MAG: hypothetical protein H7240_10950 [Glaciimonas sp.]|nr:hypothetical protein [Glaciimonas sp.]
MLNSKSALLMLTVSSLTALLFFAKQKLTRVQADQNLQKKALMTWEGEGGNFTTRPTESK